MSHNLRWFLVFACVTAVTLVVPSAVSAQVFGGRGGDALPLELSEKLGKPCVNPGVGFRAVCEDGKTDKIVRESDGTTIEHPDVTTGAAARIPKERQIVVTMQYAHQDSDTSCQDGNWQTFWARPDIREFGRTPRRLTYYPHLNLNSLSLATPNQVGASNQPGHFAAEIAEAAASVESLTHPDCDGTPPSSFSWPQGGGTVSVNQSSVTANAAGFNFLGSATSLNAPNVQGLACADNGLSTADGFNVVGAMGGQPGNPFPLGGCGIAAAGCTWLTSPGSGGQTNYTINECDMGIERRVRWCRDFWEGPNLNGLSHCRDWNGNNSSPTIYNLHQVVMHEFVHFLGVGHPATSGHNLMHPTHASFAGIRHWIGAGDRNGIKHFYPCPPGQSICS